MDPAIDLDPQRLQCFEVKICSGSSNLNMSPPQTDSICFQICTTDGNFFCDTDPDLGSTFTCHLLQQKSCKNMKKMSNLPKSMNCWIDRTEG